MTCPDLQTEPAPAAAVCYLWGLPAVLRLTGIAKAHVGFKEDKSINCRNGHIGQQISAAASILGQCRATKSHTRDLQYG